MAKSGDRFVGMFGDSQESRKQRKGELKYHPAAKDEQGVEVTDAEFKEYQEAASIAMGSVAKAHRTHLKRLFSEPRTLRLYRDLRGNGVSEEEAADMLKYGAVNYQTDENGEESIQVNRIGLYHAIGDAVKRAGGHEAALNALRRDGYMDKREHEEHRGRVKQRVENHLERLARAAVWLFMAIGVILVLISGFSMTGAVVGSTFETSLLFVIGLVFFVMGLVLKIRK